MSEEGGMRAEIRKAVPNAKTGRLMVTFTIP